MTITKSLKVSENDALELNFTMMGVLLGVWLILLFLISRHESWRDHWFSWITSLLTFVLLIVLMAQGLSLKDSGSGLRAAFQLDFSNIRYDLQDPTLWMDAIGQAGERIVSLMNLYYN